MNTLSVLFPFIIVAFFALVAFSIFRSPLDLNISIEKTGSSLFLMLSASWCAFTLKRCYTGKERSLSLYFLGKKIIRREILQKSEIRKRQEKVSSAGIGLDTVVQTLPLGLDIHRFMRAIFRHLMIRKIEGTFTFGLRNPAETGMIFGCFSAIRPLLVPCNRISLSMRPVFDKEILEGRIIAECRISQPLFIPVLMLRLAMRPHARRLIQRSITQRGGISVCTCP